MNKDVYLAIDQGTTSSRAILFSHTGETLLSAQKEISQIYPRSGWVEQDPEEIWSATKATTVEVIKAAEADGLKICGLGISNQRETTMLWDRETGEPVYNAVVWQDRRTSEFCKRLMEEKCEPYITKNTGLLLDPYFSATKIRWILDNVPGARKKANAGKLAFGTVDSFLLWRLTNGALHVTDVTNASRTSLYNIRTFSWDKELLKIFDVPASVLPQVCDSGTFFGETAASVLNVKIPILAVLGDQQAAAVGQGCFESGSVKATYGTGCFVLQNTGEEFISSRNRLLTTICYKVENNYAYAIEGSIFVAGAAVQWLRDGLKVIKDASDTERLVQSTNSNEGLYFVPAFTGLGCPYWDPDARGAMFGITRDTSREHLVRATLESVAYQTSDIFRVMARDGALPETLRVDGGMVVNTWLIQFLADILCIPVEVPRSKESTALGVGMLAALINGRYSSLSDIAGNLQIEHRYIPDLDQLVVEKCLAGWEGAVKRTILK